jgi:hypothetical protein
MPVPVPLVKKLRFLRFRFHNAAKKGRPMVPEECVGGCGSDGAGNEDGHHDPVDGDDASHDHGNDGLHDGLWSHHGHRRDTRPGFGRSVRGSHS